jgi:hypothetical protein
LSAFIHLGISKDLIASLSMSSTKHVRNIQ